MIEMKRANIGYGRKAVLTDFNLKVKKGEFLGIIGLSGAGKTTFLNSITKKADIIAGDMNVLGFNLKNISRKDLLCLRNKVAVIFQGFNLVNRLNSIENVLTGMLSNISLVRALLKLYKEEDIEKAYKYLKIVGLEKQALCRCDRLSGGQRQRVAIARALAQEPEIILADEPVAALDPYSAKQVMNVLKEINERFQVTVIANLHQLEVAKTYTKRIVGINDGKIVFDGTPLELKNKDIQMIYRKKDNVFWDKEFNKDIVQNPIISWQGCNV